MGSAQTKLRGRQKKLNFEYSVCIVLICTFAGMVALVVSFFMAGANADDAIKQNLGVTSSQLQQTTAEGRSNEASSASSVSSSASAKGVSATATSASSEAINPVKFGASPKNRSVRMIEVDHIGAKHTVTYKWEGLGADATVLYNEAGSWYPVYLPLVLQVHAGQKFTVNSDYPRGLTLYTLNERKERKGKYEFLGWSLIGEQTMPDEDIVIIGTWKYTSLTHDDPDDDKDDDDKKDDEKKDEGKQDEGTKTHSVTYLWTNAPLALETGTYVDESGNEVKVELPTSFTIGEGKEFSVDSKWKAGTKIYFRDSTTCTLQRQYVFEGWSVSGSQKMGKEDVKITGIWKDSLVSRWVKYDWHESDGEVYPEDGCVLYKPDSEKKVTVKLPESAEVVPGITIVLDEKYELDERYEERNDDGTVKCYWTFLGWDSSDVEIVRNLETLKLEFMVGDTDITIHGTWKCEEV